MPDIPEYDMPEGMSALTKSEISQLRIKIGKSHRTEKDWMFIKNLLREKVVFTAEPIDEKYRAAHSVGQRGIGVVRGQPVAGHQAVQQRDAHVLQRGRRQALDFFEEQEGDAE